jgi:hypothetical protein
MLFLLPNRVPSPSRATVHPPRYTRTRVLGGARRDLPHGVSGSPWRLPSLLRTTHFLIRLFVGQPRTSHAFNLSRLSSVIRMLLIAQLLRRRADPPRSRRLRHRPRLRPVLLLLHHPPGTSSYTPYPLGWMRRPSRATWGHVTVPPSKDHLLTCLLLARNEPISRNIRHVLRQKCKRLTCPRTRPSARVPPSRVSNQ